MRLIDADEIEYFPLDEVFNRNVMIAYKKRIDSMPTVELIRCKDCKHQEKYFHADRRRKDGGYNIYWCDLVDGYAPLGFDDEYCAWAERKEE